MQVLIAKILNRLLVVMGVFVLALFAGIFVFARLWPAYRNWYIGGFVVVAIVLSFIFKWLENSWDKSVITKMAKAGHIALANIRAAEKCLPLRDTNFVNYWIWKFEGTLYDEKHRAIEKTFYEKMNAALESVPQGSVYVTWDEAKPDQIFIIPNALIGSLLNLKPLVEGYENDKKIDVKYLDAHYNKGMVVRTFQDAIKDYQSGGKAESAKQK